MEIEIDFNRTTNYELLDKIADGKKEYIDGIGEVRYVNIETIVDIDKLLTKIQNITGEYYSLVISNDPLTIYLDKDV